MTSNARLVEAERNLNSIAKKVLGVIPIAEAWTRTRLIGELTRLGSNVDARVFDGCLRSLVDDGLVKAVGDNYQRVQPRIRVVGDKTEGDEVAAPAAPMDPMDRLGVLADKARALADEMDVVALEFAAEIERMRSDSQGLEKLRQLLKGI